MAVREISDRGSEGKWNLVLHPFKFVTRGALEFVTTSGGRSTRLAMDGWRLSCINKRQNVSSTVLWILMTFLKNGK